MNNGVWRKKREELLAKFESIRDCRRAAYMSHQCKEAEKSPHDLRIEDFLCMQLANTPQSKSAMLNTGVLEKRREVERALKIKNNPEKEVQMKKFFA